MAGAPASDAELLRLTILGRAHLENRQGDAAIVALSAALDRAPDSPLTLRNFARAQLLARNHEGALITLARVREPGGDAAATQYLTGVSLLRANRVEEAIPHLEEALRLDPRPAALRFQLAIARQGVGQLAEAEARLRETFDLDPRHMSAAFRLARLAHARGDDAEAARWDREFLRLKKILGEGSRSNEDLEACVYMDIEVPEQPDEEEHEAPIAVHFVDATLDAFRGVLAPRALVAAPLEVASDGKVSILVVEAGGTIGRLRWQAPEDAKGQSGFGYELMMEIDAPLGEIRGLVVGDYGDGAPPHEGEGGARTGSDVLLLGAEGVRLFLRTLPNGFAEATVAAGLAAARGERAAWCDHDHDGDLDLLLAGSTGMNAWSNNGDGTFSDVGVQAGLSLHVPIQDVAGADLDDDGAVDVLAALGAAGTDVHQGRHGGRFERMPLPADPWPGATRTVANLMDEDSHLDVVLLRDSELELRLLGRGQRRVVQLPQMTAVAMAVLDFDNDGRLDVAVVGKAEGGGAPGSRPASGAIRLLRNGGKGALVDWTPRAGLVGFRAPPLSDVQAADADGDGDSDLVVVADGGGLFFLRNDGGNARRQVKLVLEGTKSNPQGIGARVEILAGPFRTARWVSTPIVEVGIGSHETLDVVRTVWTTGVVDNQIGIHASAAPIVMREKLVATGSCPFLYAWDGSGFRFVTDLIGGAPLGLPLSRAQMLPVNPDEIVIVGGEDSVRPRDGKLLLEITNEFREVMYLDRAELLAVDHPRDMEVHSTSSLSFPPFLPPRLQAVAALKPPASVVGDDGVDRTVDVAAHDGRFASPGQLQAPPFRGVVEPLALTLDLDPLALSSSRTLLLTGWLQYGDSSTNIALSQLGTPILQPPRLLVETGDGARLPLPCSVGLPAGKTKTIIVNLPSLPARSRRLVLENSFEVHWDRIALATPAADLAVLRHVLPLARADLRFRGFSELASRAPGHPTTPDHERVSTRPPWRTTLEGWSTRHGDVRFLIDARDGRLAIVNSGDAVQLAFDPAGLPAVPPGWTRTFALHCIGWVRDGDHNTVGGTAVEPLPADAGVAVADLEWQLDYNTRWVARDAFAE